MHWWHCILQFRYSMVGLVSQDGGVDLRAHCSVKFPMTLKMGLERSQLFPEIFEIVLQPFWWVAGSEQPSPPLHRAAAARLLRCFHKYKSLYTTNLLAIIFLENNDLYLSKHLSRRAAEGMVAHFQPPTNLAVE